MRTRPTPRNWVSGELAPWLDGLSSDLTNTGARTLENFVVKKQGGIQRRPGSFYVSEVKASASETILIQCEIDSSNIYVLEMGNAYCRFYKNHAQIQSGGVAYEIVTPYSTADLTDLRWTYIPNEKSLYFAHHNYALRKIAWTSDASWLISQVSINSSPGFIGIISNTGFFTKDGTNFEYFYLPSNYAGLLKGKSNYIATGGPEATVLNIALSTDGKTWVKNTTGSSTVAAGVGTQDGKIYLTTATSGNIYFSNDDGYTWSSEPTTAGTLALTAIEWSDTDSGWKAVGNNISTYKKPGGAWSSLALSMSGPRAIKYASNLWVAVGSPSIATATSIAAPWSIAFSGAFQFTSVDYGTPGSLPLWVVAGGGFASSGLIYTSSNGSTWTKVYEESSASTRISNVKWVRDKFYAFYYNNNNTKYLTSVDGVTWTTHTLFSFTGGGIWNTIFDTNPSFEWFQSANHYPKTLTYHEGRLVIGPTDNNPATLWGSESSLLNNFYIGQFSDQAFSYDLASDRNVAIQWMLGGTELAIGTRTAEGVLRGSPEEGITPQTARMQWQSSFGSDNIQPIRIHDTIIFTQRGGEIVRGYVPGSGAEAWKSPDLTAFADHIARGGITEIDHQDDPQTVAHFVRSDGYGLGLTFEGTTHAWWRTKMGSTIGGYGRIESQCVIPTSGAEDEVWAIVKWTVGGATKRYIVYFDSYYFATKEAFHGVDCGYYNSAAGSATVFSACVPQLAGENVDALINGNVVEKDLVVGAGGTVTIAATNATKVHIGLRYVSYAQTMRINPNSSWGSGAGISKRNGNLNAWVYNTIGGKYGPTSSVTEVVSYTSTTELTTDCLSVNFPGQWDRDGYIWCIQDDPLPMTIIAVAPDMELGDK
jgi:hypothetical protein